MPDETVIPHRRAVDSETEKENRLLKYIIGLLLLIIGLVGGSGVTGWKLTPAIGANREAVSLMTQRVDRFENDIRDIKLLIEGVAKSQQIMSGNIIILQEAVK